MIFILAFALHLQSVASELAIYVSDNLSVPNGLASSLIPLFEKKHSCKVRLIPAGTGGQLMNRVELDTQRGKHSVQMVWGIDQQIWERIKEKCASWDSWIPDGYDQLEEAVKAEKGFLPFSYGVLTFLANKKILKLPFPKKLSDLTTPEWQRKALLEDPRTSSAGLLFVLYIEQVLGEKASTLFWKKGRSLWLTLTPGWAAAYSLFVKDEAPLVWSYLTSLAYHKQRGETHYEAILFEEGQPLQIEGAALLKEGVKDPKQLALAQAFLSFLISSEVQAMIPKKGWMMPARKHVSLPESYSNLPKESKKVRIHMNSEAMEKALLHWRNEIEGSTG